MAKLRLQIGVSDIIMSKLIFVIIDGVEFRKENYTTSRVLQSIYMFIKTHKDEISLICYKVHNSDDHVNYMHLKNGKLHNLCGRAHYSMFNDTYYGAGAYYIDGKKLTDEEWIIKTRFAKLNKLLNF